MLLIAIKNQKTIYKKEIKGIKKAKKDMHVIVICMEIYQMIYCL